MRIKDGRGKTTERIYMISATVLTLGLLIYAVWLVNDLVKKSHDAFSFSGVGGGNVPTFDFAKYEQLMGPINPASTTPATTTATSTNATTTN